jgi:demethylmenaquinone methyltransferase/2-methoxy-6-polyprenyl-1,4-benzoquinol methylase
LARRLKADSPKGSFLDLATGTGEQLLAAKELWPESTVVGLDFSRPMLELARTKIDKLRLAPPAPVLVEADALEAPFEDAAFDSVSISFGLRNILDRKELYRTVMRILKPLGRFLVLELYFDSRQPLACLQRLYLEHITPLLASALFWSQRKEYIYLSRTVLAFPHPALIADEMKQAGFIGLDLRTFTFGTAMLVWGHKPLS